ncbi:MAG: winged helix-turn-helix domain-containing protein [Promethearchaeati archaeon SRVP18_Atabeyarchaeia-1]
MADEARIERKAENSEESVFKTISSPKRRDIIRLLGENTEATFTEIKHSTGEDSPSLSYHLSTLEKLVEQREGRYALSELGQEVYKLMNEIIASTSGTSMIGSARKAVAAMIIANAILWAAAILSVSVFEGRLSMMTLYSFSALWFVSNIALYSISKKLEWSGTSKVHDSQG